METINDCPCELTCNESSEQNGHENLFIKITPNMDTMPNEIFAASGDNEGQPVENNISNGSDDGKPDNVPNESTLNEEKGNVDSAVTPAANNKETKEDLDEDMPLSQLIYKQEQEKSQTEVSNRGSSTDRDHYTVGPSSPHPFSHIRGRAALRGGSPLNSSFTVKSEPTTPSLAVFPRLRKAEGLCSLAQSSRKRHRVDSPEGQTNKRPRPGWFSVARWWSSEEAAEDIYDSDSTLPVAETAAAPRSCSLM